MSHRRDPYITNYSRQRAMRTDLKILQFQEALERQERSVKKLREEGRQDMSTVSMHKRSRDPVEHIQIEEIEMAAPRREPKPYIPLSKQQLIQPALTREQLKQWEYLQSMEYQRYLQQILCSANDQKALVQKIKALRSNSIYLSKVKHIEEERSYQEAISKPISFYQPRNAPTFDQLASCSKITERQAYFPQGLNCRPYLEKNSMFDQNQEEQNYAEEAKHEDMIAAYPQREPQQMHNIRIEQEEQDDIPMTPHCQKRREQNVKTVIRAKPPIINNALIASTKINQTNQQRQRQKMQFIARQLSRYDKENKSRKEVTPSKSPSYPNRNNNVPQQSKAPLPERSYKKANLSVPSQTESTEQSRQFYRKDRMDVSAASLYNIDFKLDRPDRQQRSFARCTSSITLSAQKSISRSKSQSKIKMSVVTASGRPGR